MRIKYIAVQAVSIVLMVIAMVGCKSDYFTLELQLENLGTKNLRVVYATGGAVVDEWVTAEQGVIKYKGSSPELTVLEIFDQKSAELISIAVKNGDKIKVTGKADDPNSLEVSGSDVSEEWIAFVRKAISEKGTKGKVNIDKEIEKYIADNPDNVVSTLLLMNNYSSLANTSLIDSLVLKIKPEARPEQLLTSFNLLRRDEVKKSKVEMMGIFTLFDSKGDFSSLQPRDSKCSIVMFWSTDDKVHRIIVDSIKSLKKQYDKKLQVADVNVDGDTTMWRQRVKADSISGAKHFWAPGGQCNESIQRFNVDATPVIMVVDSIGKVKYRGNDLNEAMKESRVVLNFKRNTSADLKK